MSEPLRARAVPDQGAAVVISACPGGPLLVRGPARVLDAAGRPVDPGRATFALCRCGATRTAPFCDGTHKLRRSAPGQDGDDPGGADQDAGAGA